jgi:hypothetical protein
VGGQGRGRVAPVAGPAGAPLLRLERFERPIGTRHSGKVARWRSKSTLAHTATRTTKPPPRPRSARPHTLLFCSLVLIHTHKHSPGTYVNVCVFYFSFYLPLPLHACTHETTLGRDAGLREPLLHLAVASPCYARTSRKKTGVRNGFEAIYKLSLGRRWGRL